MYGKVHSRPYTSIIRSMQMKLAELKGNGKAQRAEGLGLSGGDFKSSERFTIEKHA